MITEKNTHDILPSGVFEGPTKSAGQMGNENTYHKFEAGEHYIKGVPIWLHFDTISRLEYADPMSSWLDLLFRTYARIRESDKWGNPSPEYESCCIVDNFMWWPRGKRQEGMRHAYIPPKLQEKLITMRKVHAAPEDRMFNATAKSLSRRFNKHYRPKLHPMWRMKIKVKKGAKIPGHKIRKNPEPYLISLKSYRKTGITVAMCYEYIKLCRQYRVKIESWNYALWKMAFAAVMRESGHRTEKMILDHYLIDIHEIGAMDYALANPIDSYSSMSQPVLHHFIEKARY